MKVERWNTERDGPMGEHALRRRLEELGYGATLYQYPPGTQFPPHEHEVDKIDAVVSGRFRIDMEGHSVVLEAGDMVAVPRGTRHRAEVVGDDPVISLDAVRRGR